MPFEWMWDRHSVPLAAGEKTFGKKMGGITVTMSGQLAIGGDTTSGDSEVFGEDGMWGLVEDFANHLNTGDAEQFLELFLYFDDVADEYRKFKSVRPISFVPQFGDDKFSLWGFSLQLFIGDPTIYTTGPGL